MEGEIEQCGAMPSQNHAIPQDPAYFGTNNSAIELACWCTTIS